MDFREIPFFDYKKLYLDYKKDYLRIFDEVASKGAFIMQKDLDDFEIKLAEFSKSKFAIGVGNATDGLELCLMAIGLNKGDEIICSSHTMIASASAIIMAGGVPVPVDIGDDNLISTDAINDAINYRTVGIMPTQLNGRICDMDKICEISRKNNLFIVEDAAQALGAKYNGKNAGTFGEASAISFYPAKLLGCFGDAGGILTSNEKLYNKIYQLHDHGRNKNSGESVSWGRNSRMDNLQAAFLNFSLPNFKKVIERRRFIAEKYNHFLKDLEQIKLPPSPEINSINFDVYQNYEIEADYRDKLKIFLCENGIGTIIQWGGKGIHQWEKLGFTQKLPNVEKFFERCLMLPINMFVSDEDIEYICSKINHFYEQKLYRKL